MCSASKPALLRAVVAIFVASFAGCGGSVSQNPESGPAREGYLLLLDDLGVPSRARQVMVDNTVVVTDDRGYARLPTVGASYDVTLRAGGYLYAYQGMTTRSPIIRVRYGSMAQAVEHSVGILVHTPNLGPGLRAYIHPSVSGPGVLSQGFGFNSAEGDYWADIDWAGSELATLTLESFLAEYDTTSHAVKGFLGYAKVQREVSGGDDVEWTPAFELPQFGESTITVSVKRPDGQAVFQSIAFLQSPAGIQYISRADGSTDTQTFVVPDLPGARFSVSIDTYGMGNASGQAHDMLAGGMAEVVVPPSPQVTAPQSGAVVDLDTEFAWSVPEGAIRYMYAYGDNTLFTMMIASASSVVRLPDLSPLGLALAPGTTWSWHGDFDQGPRSMDEFAAGGCEVRGWGASLDQTFTVGP